MNISEEELELFSRHLILNEFNEKSFENLRKQKIALIGVGGIGCPAAQYLISTGIKNIKLIDGDVIQKNNLNRQTLYTTNDIGKNKTLIAKKRLLKINSKCNIDAVPNYLNLKNINIHLKKSSLIIDTTDNWKSMLLINDYCVKKSLPLISSSVVGFDSQTILFDNVSSSHLCLQCIFPNKQEIDLARCESVGILGTAAGMAGLIVAQKVINFFLENKSDKFITIVNTKSLQIDNLKLKKNINCPQIKKNK